MRWTVGQTVVVWTPWGRRNVPTDWADATITKIGRKWVTFRHNGWSLEGRFDPETGAVDAGRYMTQSWVYPDRATAEAELTRQATWRALLAAMRNAFGDAPRDLTIAQMHEIARACGLPLTVSAHA